MNSIICEAIRSRSIIRCYYDGSARDLEPYRYGLNLENEEVLSARQISGNSKSGKSVGWKKLTVSKMSNIEITQNTFVNIDIGYNKQGDPKIKEVYCQIQ